MKVLFTIAGCEVTIQDDGSLTWTGPAMIDGDGIGGNAAHDPYFQSTTSLRPNSQSLNSEAERYIVVPPQILYGVAPVVLGCQAYVFNHLNGKETEAVVGDIGPTTKIGEISIACAEALGIPSSPLTGGEEKSVISYRISPGKSAKVGDKKYNLQPA